MIDWPIQAPSNGIVGARRGSCGKKNARAKILKEVEIESFVS
jgi:hypothetical protein